MSNISNKQEPLTGWARAEFVLENSSRVLLYGLPGTGKTMFGLTKFLKDKPSFRLICAEDMTDTDLIGGPKMIDGVWKFQEGVGIQAWRTGGRLVVDEINKVSKDVESKLMALIDSEASASWTNDWTGEVVKPHKDFTVVATMNGEPDDLAPAIQDRFVVRCEVNDVYPEAIQSLPEYLRSLATVWTSPDADVRYSLRSFIMFEELFSRTNDLNKSTQSVFPEIAGVMFDALTILNNERKAVI